MKKISLFLVLLTMLGACQSESVQPTEPNVKIIGGKNVSKIATAELDKMIEEAWGISDITNDERTSFYRQWVRYQDQSSPNGRTRVFEPEFDPEFCGYYDAMCDVIMYIDEDGDKYHEYIYYEYDDGSANDVLQATFRVLMGEEVASAVVLARVCGNEITSYHKYGTREYTNRSCPGGEVELRGSATYIPNSFSSLYFTPKDVQVCDD